MVRYDLIPKTLWDRLAERFTGHMVPNPDGDKGAMMPNGGALKYGEGNWEKGLPTSDVINHIINHITSYQENFRNSLVYWIMQGLQDEALMSHVRADMITASEHDDDLAAAVWGIAVLMHQEKTKMFHDSNFKYPVVNKDNKDAPKITRS